MQVIDILAPHKLLYFFLLCLSMSAVGLAACSDISPEQARKINEALNDSLLSTTETWGVDMVLIEEGLKKVRVQGSYAITINNSDLNETRIRGPVYIEVFDSTERSKHM
jgi:hypothetical protein